MQQHANPSRKKPTGSPLLVEPLEDRHLLSGLLIGPVSVGGQSYSQLPVQSTTSANVAAQTTLLKTAAETATQSQSYSYSQTNQAAESYSSPTNDGSQADATDKAYSAQQQQPNSAAEYGSSYDTNQQKSTAIKTGPQTPVQPSQAAPLLAGKPTITAGPALILVPAAAPSTAPLTINVVANQQLPLLVPRQTAPESVQLASAIPAAAFDNANDRQVESQAQVTFLPTNNYPFSLAPQLGHLIGGAVPFDLVALEQGMEKFFAQLEDLGQDITNSQAAIQLTRWLVVAVFANAAYEVACWLHKPARAACWTGWPTLGTSGFPLLVDLPEETS